MSSPMPWPGFRRVERQARRVQEMMERLDVDAARLARVRQGEAYAEARTRCLVCGTSDKCVRWLDNPATSGERPDFCPNLTLFDAFKQETPPRAGQPE